MALGKLMTPATASEVRECVANAIADGSALEVVGGGSKRGIGNPQRVVTPLSTRSLSGIVDYDPAELVLTVGAGTPLAEIETLLSAHQQMLAFEPFELGCENAATIGGVVGAGIAGSRRLSAGGVRDHVLGFTAVSGRAEIFKAGGRVVKNVTGYDLSKLIAGSWGRLVILTEITLKVLPRPRTAVTLQFAGLEEPTAFAVMTRAMRSQAFVAAAAYVPREIAGQSLTLLRLEGFGASVEVRAALLAELFQDVKLAPVRLEATPADSLWSSIQNARLIDATDAVLWRLSVPRTAGLEVATKLREVNATLLFDWAGGLVWASVPASSAPQSVRAIASTAQGHAMLVRAPDALRAEISALHPETPGVAALARRVKDAFDPHSILDPQRFVVSAS